MLEEQLLDDEKQCAEHIMLVDLGRNDVGKVSLKQLPNLVNIIVQSLNFQLFLNLYIMSWLDKSNCKSSFMLCILHCCLFKLIIGN